MAQPYPRAYGQYVLLERLGTGGMSEVDLARKVVDEGSFIRFLVVKRIKADRSSDPSFVRMFKDEARITSELHHANIGALYDFGKVDDEYYLALEYVPGMDVRHLISALRERGQRVPVRVALKITAEVLDALDHAHNKRDTYGRAMGIVHRDVNPRNVMVSVRGEVKLIDFGVAKAVDRLEQTRTDHVKGKYAYMAPEQLTGKAVDHRSDVYAAGLLLNELLAGVSPFAGLNHVQVVHRMISGQTPELPPTPELTDDAALRRVHDKALAQEVEDRYPTAAEMAADLRQVAAALGGLPTNTQLAAFLEAVEPDLAPKLHARMAAYAAAEPPEPRPPPPPIEPTLTSTLAPGPAGDPPRPPPTEPESGSVSRTGLLAGSFLVVSVASAAAAVLASAVVVLAVVLATRGAPGPAPALVPADPVEVPGQPGDPGGVGRPEASPGADPAGADPQAGGAPAAEPSGADPGGGDPGSAHPGADPGRGVGADPGADPRGRDPGASGPGGRAAGGPSPSPTPRGPTPAPEVHPARDPASDRAGPAPEPAPAQPQPTAPQPSPPAPVEVRPPGGDDLADFGLLNVTAPVKGATVLVDGVPSGETALVRHRVGVGDHTVEVPGYTCSPRTVTVRRSQVVNVTCR